MRIAVLSALALATLATPSLRAGVLDDVPVGGTVEVVGLEALSTGGQLELRRIEVVAPGSRTIVVLPDGRVEEVPRSKRLWFVPAAKSLHQRFWISVAEDGTTFDGMVFDPDGARSLAGTVTASGLRLEQAKALPPAPAQGFSCGMDGHTHAIAAGSGPALPPIVATRTKGAAILHEAVVAVDTDNELLLAKFANNTTNATSYLDQLFAGMNVFFERDLDVRLLRGHTILRVAADPYSATSTSAQLSEVGAHWRDNQDGIARAFVMFLSGKSPGASSAAGIAWLLTSGNYCDATGNPDAQAAGHFSATQVFKFAGSNASHDVTIVGHELGHNFGADHTHCTSMAGVRPASTNTIDQCFNGEAAQGCYAGPVSCPNDNTIPGRGSIMGYCHYGAPSGAGCGGGGLQGTLQEFHPVHQGVLDARIATNIANGCFTAAAGVPIDRVFYDGFE